MNQNYEKFYCCYDVTYGKTITYNIGTPTPEEAINRKFKQVKYSPDMKPEVIPNHITGQKTYHEIHSFIEIN